MPDATRFTTHRRGFLGRLAGLLAFGAAGVAPGSLAAEPLPRHERGADPQLDAWFDKIHGKYAMVFDGSTPNGGMPAIWPRVYLNTINDTYGMTDADTSTVLICRHEGAPLALNDAMWAKYGFGKSLNVKDGDAPAKRNVYAKIEGVPIPGLGITELLKAGVQVGVCNVALTMLSGSLAKKMGLDAAAVKSELVANRFPGVQVVPSGVMAVGVAQAHGCGYTFAG